MCSETIHFTFQGNDLLWSVTLGLPMPSDGTGAPCRWLKAILHLYCDQMVMGDR